MTSKPPMSETTADAKHGIPPAGFRLPAATRLGPVHLQVADLARSLAYYERVMGLRLLTRGNGTATLGPQGAANPLVELCERPGAKVVPRGSRLGLYHFAILLPDRAALGRFVTHLTTLGVRPGMSDHLVSEALYLTDPDGLGIEVYADRPRESWRYDGRQLVMTTAPLDVDDLVRAAHGEPWTGIPAGTVIGHVHFFVGDLETAAAFYHAGLGFDKVVWNYPGALFLSAGGYHHHVGTNTWAANAAPARDDEARLLEWELVLPTAADVETALANLDRQGLSRQPDGDGGRGVVLDPWGTPVRLSDMAA